MVMRRRGVWVARTQVALVFLVMCNATTFAQATDVVAVMNGDRFNGDVRRLERGSLAFRTPAAGTIDITWSQVVTLTSSKDLLVELASGARYSGSISSPSDGLLVVQTTTGPTMPIALSEIIRITPVEATFLERTTGSVDFGLTATTDTRTYTLDGSARNRTRFSELRLDLSSWLSEQDGSATRTRNLATLDVRRFLQGRWFILALAEGHQEDELELDWRFVLGGGIGRMLVQSNEMLLAVEGGANYDGERFTNESETDRSAEVFGGVDWDWFPSGPTEVAVTAKTYISLDQARARIEFNATVRRDVFWDLYWSVNAYDSFDSDPPDDRPRSAFGVAVGLGWSF
jgi:hypothetical protein